VCALILGELQFFKLNTNNKAMTRAEHELDQAYLSAGKPVPDHLIDFEKIMTADQWAFVNDISILNTDVFTLMTDYADYVSELKERQAFEAGCKITALYSKEWKDATKR
jgi:hypothetical protein